MVINFAQIKGQILVPKMPRKRPDTVILTFLLLKVWNLFYEVCATSIEPDQPTHKHLARANAFMRPDLKICLATFIYFVYSYNAICVKRKLEFIQWVLLPTEFYLYQKWNENLLTDILYLQWTNKSIWFEVLIFHGKRHVNNNKQVAHLSNTQKLRQLV